MAYEKIKQEVYMQYGGINTKASEYITGLHECLDLQNFDFTTPGAWTQRWGSTQYMGKTLSGRILGLYEYEKLSGWSIITTYQTSNLWYLAGTSLYAFNIQGVFTYGITNFGGVTFTVVTGSTPAAPNYDANLFSYQTFLDTLFMCNGSSGSFLKYSPFATGASFSDPSNAQSPVLFSLPPGVTDGMIGVSNFASTAGVTGFFQVGYGWLDRFGFRSSPASLNGGVSLSGSTAGFNLYVNASLIPWSYGVTAISVYLSRANGSQLFLYSDFSIHGFVIPAGIADQYYFSNYATMISIPINGTTANINNLSTPAQFPLYMTLAPKFIEIYNNQLFCAGFTSYTTGSTGTAPFLPTVNYQSRVLWSDVGAPQFIDPTYFAEVRTNDGDRISGLKSFQSNLLIFKTRSFHELYATSATDVAIRQISDQYGSLSNKAIVTFNQQCLFLDRKGIIKWDGANISVASNKIEPLFKRMNIVAAQDNAVGIHFKQRNEAWFAIPVDGATLNNIVAVYDYFADAWTTFSGFVPSVLSTMKGSLTDYTTFYGSYSGAIYNFGQSLFSDSGQAITLMAKTMFYRDLGNSVTKEWRRLFVDSTILSAASTLTINMIPDHGTSIYLTRYMGMGAYQNRIDFGIPAKSMQFQFIYANATLTPFRMYGHTPESRYERSV